MQQLLAAVALGWFFFIVLVCTIGCVQLYRHYTTRTSKPISSSLLLERVPHVTLIRPVAGLETNLYECLASTFHQNYPASRLTIYFCVSSKSDPAYPTLTKLLGDYANRDVRIFVEEDDPNLDLGKGREHILGPNPKIRNMSRAYREAKGDIIWIVDCNVWVSKSAAGLMVDLLCGFAPTSNGRKYKFVHQLPLTVDIFQPGQPQGPQKSSLATSLQRRLTTFGSLLDEMFMSTAHGKFYTAISTVAIAPCTVGKSNMFRRSHLDGLTPSSIPGRSAGIDFFSDNICEDHLIGDLLWRTKIPKEVTDQSVHEGQPADTEVPFKPWGNHALLFTPPCIQPIDGVSISTYAARRTRWLRVRKSTVPAATLVEPATESILATLIGTYGLTTLNWCHVTLHIPQSWPAFWTIWLILMLGWNIVDFCVWRMLQSWSGEDEMEEAGKPSFVGSGRKRTYRNWLFGWFGREILAFPIWAWAVLGGTTVIWRGRRFWVGMDMKVHAIDEAEHGRKKIDERKTK